MVIIGRDKERHILTRRMNSGKPEFVAVYGRRRVGKTFLITEYFNNKFTFSVTGISEGSLKDQLRVFHEALKKHFHIDMNAPVPADWFRAFQRLAECLEKDITQGRKVLFFDEMPWLDTPKSKFISALEHFWNSFASRREGIFLIVCGSAASWIINKLLENYGGLHNRLTESIVIEPFSLYECEAFYRSRGLVMNRRQIAEAYMILGGIPYYMDAMDKFYGLNQNIDLLLFDKNAKLANEFNRLYHSLFRHADNHINIAETLSKKSEGMTRQEISAASGISDGGGLTKVLDEMEACGLISRSFDYKKKRGGDYFKLIDFYTIFYYKFIKNRKGSDPRFWTNYLSYPAHSAWCGYAFERLCMAHIAQIKQKLGISGVITETYAFRSAGQRNTGPKDEPLINIGQKAGAQKNSGHKSNNQKAGAQIDIIIDRKDGVINLCECKYTVAPYELTKIDATDFERKKSVFLETTGTKKAIHMTMITASGLVQNAYRNDIQSEIILDDLFMPI